MSSDEPKNSAQDAPSTGADSPGLPIEEQPTVNLRAADLRHTETPATSVPPVVLPPVAPPSGFAPKKPAGSDSSGTEETTLRLPVPGAPAGRRPGPQPPSAQVSPAAPHVPAVPAGPHNPVSPAAPRSQTPSAPQSQTRPAGPQSSAGPQARPGPTVPVSPGAPQAPAGPASPRVPVSPAPQSGAESTSTSSQAGPSPAQSRGGSSAAQPHGGSSSAQSPVSPSPGRPKPSPGPVPASGPDRERPSAGPADASAPETAARRGASTPDVARKVVAPPGPEDDHAAPAAAKPDHGDAGPAAEGGDGAGVPADGADGEAAAPAPRRMSATTVMIALLLLLFGFTLVVQLKANDGDTTLLTMRQEDLVRILSDLESQEQRTQAEVAELEDTKESLSSGAETREAALREASERADALGVLAGELPARGRGLVIKINGGDDQVEADDLLNAVQELRGAGAEAMQIEGGDGTAVRIVASTSFQDSAAGQGGDRFGVIVDGKRLTSTYTITVIGDPKTMETALRIPGGVIESITDNGGNVTPLEQGVVDVSAIHDVTTLRYARPVS